MFIQCFCEIANKKRRKRSYYWHRSHLNFIYVCFYFNLSFQFFLFIVSVYCQFICLIYFHTLTSPPSLLSLLYWIIREVSNYLIICSFFLSRSSSQDEALYLSQDTIARRFWKDVRHCSDPSVCVSDLWWYSS